MTANMFITSLIALQIGLALRSGSALFPGHSFPVERKVMPVRFWLWVGMWALICVFGAVHSLIDAGWLQGKA